MIEHLIPITRLISGGDLEEDVFYEETFSKEEIKSHQEYVDELRESYHFENQGWVFKNRAKGCYLVAPSRNLLTILDISNPRNLKFGDSKSIERMQGARYFYLLKKYNELLDEPEILVWG